MFRDDLDEYVAGLELNRLAVLDDKLQAELARCPLAVSARRGHEVALPHERYRNHRAVREALERLAARTPRVLVVDDVHWPTPPPIECSARC